VDGDRIMITYLFDPVGWLWRAFGRPDVPAPPSGSGLGSNTLGSAPLGG
jgi:hypothetical protein